MKIPFTDASIRNLKPSAKTYLSNAILPQSVKASLARLQYG
jgi:hypothetical protein